MFNESKTNFVAVAGTLERRFPSVFNAIAEGVQSAGMQFFVIAGSSNIWVRDWLPVQVGKSFVKFRYGYGDDNSQFESLKVNRHDWRWLSDVRQSKIRLDGGNCQREGDFAVMTDVIFKHNPGVTPAGLTARLEKLLDAELVIIPPDPADDLLCPEGLGHSDGSVHFVPGTRKILVDDFWSRRKSRQAGRYWESLCRALGRFEIVPLPNACEKMPYLSDRQFREKFPEGDTWNPGFGYYINLLVAGHVVFLPKFGVSEDAEALAIAKRHFVGYKIIQVDCRELSMCGGLCQCVSWNAKM